MMTLVGPSALSYNGLIAYYPNRYTVTTSLPSFNNKTVYDVRLLYLPSIDSDSADIRDTVMIPLGKARIPSAERAIIDYIQFESLFDLGFMCEGLEEYARLHANDLSALYSYALKRGLRRELQDALSMCDI